MKIYANLGEKRQTQRRMQLKAQRIARDLKLKELTAKVAKSIMDPMKKVTVNVNGDIVEFSTEAVINDYLGRMSMTDSIWAPWSKSFKK